MNSNSGYIRFTNTDQPADTVDIDAKDAARFIANTGYQVAYHEREAIGLLMDAASEESNPILVDMLRARAECRLLAADVYRRRLHALTTESGVAEMLLAAYIKQLPR
jgi:hypothetical protein